MRSRRWSVVALCTGAALLGGSVAFRLVAVPALVRFPDNVDQTARYTGTALTYVDPATLLPLSTPKSDPLSLSRHVKVVSSDFNRAVIDETVTIQAGATTSVENYQYVMDRRSMKLVADPRQYAFGDPTATMHAAGTYRINFAMGTTAGGSYLAYIPEADASTPLVLARGRHYHANAHATVIDFSSKLEAPVAPYYLAHLKSMGLPTQVTAAQLQPLLLASGIDVNKALADVGPKLTPQESALLAATLAKPVTLNYFFIADGLVSIEPTTGALVDVHAQQEGVAVQPDLSGVAALKPLLDKYSGIPSVRALSTGLAALAARPPQPAQTFQYVQTPASSLAIATKAHQQARLMGILNWWAPAVLALLGLILIGFGLVGWRRTRVPAPDGSSDHSLGESPTQPSTPGGPTIPVPVSASAAGPPTVLPERDSLAPTDETLQGV